MMMEEFIQRQSWMSFTQYASLAGISRISPGMNLVALTILVGLRQSGPAGVPVALLGLTLPSLLVIGVLCGLVRSAARSPMVLGAMQGVNGVVVGLLLAAGWRTLEELRREAPDRFVVCLAIVGVSLAASLLLAWGPVQVLLLAAGISMMPVWLRSRRDE
jgi:chromate transporter